MAEFKNITDIWVTKPPFEIDKAYVVIPYEDEDEKTLRAHLGEIVRCGDCKWFQCNMNRDGTLPNGVPEYECRHWCGECDPTDFCSYAERRTE